MAVFPAAYFSYSTRYPESGSRLQLARSYAYTVEPDAPDQRVFTLSLMGMQYFTDANNSALLAEQPERNMWTLESFYNTHRLHESFTFNHPVYGALTCKFNRPLDVPAGLAGANGLLPTFDVELVEIP